MLNPAWKPCGLSSAANGPKVSKSWGVSLRKVGWGPEQHSRLVACIYRVVLVQSTSNSSSHKAAHLHLGSQPTAHNPSTDALPAASPQQHSEAKGRHSVHRGSPAGRGGSFAGVNGRESQSPKPIPASSPSPYLPREARPLFTHPGSRSKSTAGAPAPQAPMRKAKGTPSAARYSKPQVRDSHLPTKRTLPPLSLLLKRISRLPPAPLPAPSAPKASLPGQQPLLTGTSSSLKPYAAQHHIFSKAHHITSTASHVSKHPSAPKQPKQTSGWSQPHERSQPAMSMDASALASNAAHQLYLLGKIMTELQARQQEQGGSYGDDSSSSSRRRKEAERGSWQQQGVNGTAEGGTQQESSTKPLDVPSTAGWAGLKQKQQAQGDAARLKQKQQERVRAALVHLVGVLMGRAGAALDDGAAEEEGAAAKQYQHQHSQQQQQPSKRQERPVAQEQQPVAQQQQQQEGAANESSHLRSHHFSTAQGPLNSISRAANSAAAAVSVGREDEAPGRLPAAHGQPLLLAYLDARQLAMAAWALTKVRSWMSAADVHAVTAGIVRTALDQSSVLEVPVPLSSSSPVSQRSSPSDAGTSGSGSSSSSSGSPGHCSDSSNDIEDVSSVSGAEQGRCTQGAWGGRHLTVTGGDGEEDEEEDGGEEHGGEGGASHSGVMHGSSRNGGSVRDSSSVGGSSNSSNGGQNSSSSSGSRGRMADANAHGWARSSGSSSSRSTSSKNGSTSGSMADADAHSWAMLLHSLATLGVRCTKRSPALALFSRGACVALPLLLSAGRAGDQDCSNALHGCVVAGLPLQRTKRLIHALSTAVSKGQALHKTRHSPHAWSDILWSLAKLEVYDRELVARGAHAMALASDQIKVHQQLTNTLWALGSLGWYTPEVYCKLDRALVPFVARSSPQELSIALLGCAHARHISEAVRDLCTRVRLDHWDAGRGCFAGWGIQDHTITLYAWAVLRTSAVTADASGSDCAALDALAAALFQSLTHMDPHPDAARPDQLCQLFQAHQTAQAPLVQLKQGGLHPGSYLLASAEDAWYNYVYQSASSVALYRNTSQVLQELVRALRIAGYRVARVMQPCGGPSNNSTVTTTVTTTSNTSSWGSSGSGGVGSSSSDTSRGSNGFCADGYSIDGFTNAGSGGSILGPILIDILVPHPSCVNGIALELSAEGEYLHSPTTTGHPSNASSSKRPKGRMRGPPFMRLWHIRQWCDAVVLVREEEWANLRGDPLRQRDYMAYRMRYALEAAADSKKMAVREAVQAAAAAATPASEVASATAGRDVLVAPSQQTNSSLVHEWAGAARAVDVAERGAASGVPSADAQLNHYGHVSLGAEQGDSSRSRTPLPAAHLEHTLHATAPPLPLTPAPQLHPPPTGQASSASSSPDHLPSLVVSTIPSAPALAVHAPGHQASFKASAVQDSSVDPLPAAAVHARASSDTPHPLPGSHPAPLLPAHTAGHLSSTPSLPPVFHAPMPPSAQSLTLKSRPLRPQPSPHSPPAFVGAAPCVLYTQSDHARQMWPQNMPLSTSAPPGSASPPSMRTTGLGMGAVLKKVTVKPRLAPVISGFTRNSIGYSIQWPDGSSSSNSGSNQSSSYSVNSSDGSSRTRSGSWQHKLRHDHKQRQK